MVVRRLETIIRIVSFIFIFNDPPDPYTNQEFYFSSKTKFKAAIKRSATLALF